MKLKIKLFLTKMLKSIYGVPSVGLRYENGIEVIIRNYGSSCREKFTNGKDSRFYHLFEYTFTNKEAKYSAECKRIKFERRNIFKNAFDFLKDEFNLPNGLIPEVNYDTTDSEFNDMGKKLNYCYSVLLDMLFFEDELKIDNYKPKINEILFDVSNNNSTASHFFGQGDDYNKRKEAFMSLFETLADENISDMEIFYKSGSLKKICRHKTIYSK